MTPRPPIEVSASILRDSARQATTYADLCPECGEEMRTHCRNCGHREEQQSETRQGDLPSAPANTAPNTYTVRYTDHKQERHAIEINETTADCAIVHFIATHSIAGIRDITATLKPSHPLKFSELFH